MSWLADLLGYQTVINSVGTRFPSRKILRFVTGTVVDNPALGTTDVTPDASNLVLNNIGQSGATTGQVARWSGSMWAAFTLRAQDIVNNSDVVGSTVRDALNTLLVAMAFVPAVTTMLFGDGSDGPGPTSGTVTLTRDAYYTDWSPGNSLIFNFNGCHVYVNGRFYLGNASTGFARAVVGNAANAAGQVSGTGGVGYNPVTFAGGVSGNGNVNAVQGAGTAGQTPSPGAQGGASGPSGKGGDGATAGGAGAATNTVNGTLFRLWRDSYPVRIQGNIVPIAYAGSGGSSGGTGGGVTSSAFGGGAGGGGAGGAGIRITCRILDTGNNLAPDLFLAQGGNGSNGGNGSSSTTGGGGGGSGGGGGWIMIAYGTRVGNVIPNACNVSGGAGGNGGNGGGAANGGGGGGNGAAGRVTVIDLMSGFWTVDTFPNTTPTAGSPNSGNTGGAGAPAISVRVAL